jgi:hypothetical protein
MKTEEGKVKDGVKAFLKSRRVASLVAPVSDAVGYYHMPVQASSYGSPTLDFTVCYRGVFMLVETKKKGDVPTQRQKQIMELVRKAGGQVVWGDSVETICAQLRAMFDEIDGDVAWGTVHILSARAD